MAANKQLGLEDVERLYRDLKNLHPKFLRRLAKLSPLFIEETDKKKLAKQVMSFIVSKEGMRHWEEARKEGLMFLQLPKHKDPRQPKKPSKSQQFLDSLEKEEDNG